MKKLILQSLIFVFIALCVIAGSVFLTNNLVSRKAKFTLAGIDKIVLGHSHTECAYNDSLVRGLKNFGHSGESYFYTYYKIIPVLEKNPAIKTVFIEFTNNYFEDPENKMIWGSSFISYQYPRPAPFFDSKGNLELITHNPIAFLNVQSLVMKENLAMIQSWNFEYSKKTGAYQHLVRDKTDSLLARGADTIKTIFNISEKNLGYLRKLIDYCKITNRDVYLLRSPVHARYPGLKFEDRFQEARANFFPDVEFLDFRNFPLLNSEFGDLQHLNFRGARKFSLFFDELLENGLLTQVEKQAFIVEYYSHHIGR